MQYFCATEKGLKNKDRHAFLIALAKILVENSKQAIVELSKKSSGQTTLELPSSIDPFVQKALLDDRFSFSESHEMDWKQLKQHTQRIAEDVLNEKLVEDFAAKNAGTSFKETSKWCARGRPLHGDLEVARPQVLARVAILKSYFRSLFLQLTPCSTQWQP